ncbi:retrovirus-related pol polyprotein from transposon TNT 1-94 [Tanacetum coccineum]
MTTLAEHIIVAGAETRPPMLEKSMYDSCASRIRLFIKGKKHGMMMLDSIDNGPLVYPTVIEIGQTRPKKYSELTEAQQLQDDCDVQAMNTVLHGLPPDVYALVNHQEAAKDIWDRVKMLMNGTELSYQEREYRLYNLFDKFAYVQVQVNTKFLNDLPSEWSKFVTDVKLTKSLYTTNYDQLYAYLSQHERHANEVCITRERYSNPLSFVASSPTIYIHLSHHNIQQEEDVIECINKAMAFLSVVASRFPPSNNQLKTSSNPRNQATIQDGNRGIATTSNGNVAAGQPRVVKCYNCQGEGHMILIEEQLAFLVDPGISKAPVAQQTIPQNSAFQTDDLDAYDSDCDDLSSAKTVLMANLSSYDPEVFSEYPEQTHVDDFEDNEICSGSNIIPYSRYLQESQDAVIQDTNPSTPNDLLVLSLVEQMTDHEIDTLKENLSNNVKEKESLSKTLTVFKTESKEKESKYTNKKIVLEKQNKELENIIYKMYRSMQAMHMLTKPQVFYDDTHKQALGYQNPFHLKKAQRIQSTLYDDSVIAKEHAIKEDFGKRFVTQKELSAEQAFWLKHSSLSETPVTSHTPVRIEAPSELPKHCISLELATQLNQEIFQRENYGENLNAPTFNQLFEINELKAQSQEKDTIIRKLKEKIKFLSGKDSVKNVKKDIDEIETINIELEHSVAKLLSENKILRKEREHLKSIYKDQFDLIRKTRVQSKEQCDSLIAQINAKSLKNSDLNAQLQEKVFAIAALKNKLRKLKGKNIVDTAVSKPNATIALGMFKLDIEPIYPRLKNKKDAHKVYIKKTIEYTDTLCGFIKCARTQYPSEPLLESSCMFTKHVQELLVYASQTCPNSPIPSEKLVVVTPINKEKIVRFAALVTSSNNIPKQTDSLKTKDSNKPLLTSTGVKPTTSASGSKPSGNTKKNRITRPPHSNQKNKVEDHPRKVKSSVNKTNYVSEPISNALVKHSMRNAKFESIYAICNKCLFDANHDMCLIDFVNDVNWKPTGRFFTIVDNSCPLTRITSKKIVHLKETTPKLVETPKPEIKVYSRRPKQIKSVCSSKQAKIVESKIANNSEPTHLWGSNAIDVPSSSSLVNDSKFMGTVRFGNDKVAKIIGYGDYQQGNVIISRVYYVERLRHNLFSVGQFCDANLEVIFQKNACLIRNLEGVDLLSGSRDTNLYTISLDDMLNTSPIFLLSKASKTKSWLWHRRLSHLNFGTLNKLAKENLARGIPKLKFQKDHLCSVCALEKGKKSSHQPKAEDTNQEKLYLLHMDLRCV